MKPKSSPKLFQNLNPEIKPKGFLDMLKWKLSSRPQVWPKNIPIDSYDIPPRNVGGNKIRISFIGHVSFLIQTQGLNILTDPVYSKRASPFSFIGPKRVTPPGIEFDRLPKIDVILISHNHYDHMDISTIKKLWNRGHPQIITPLGNDVILKANIPGIEVTTLNWSENIKIKHNFECALEPAQHWSARGLFDRNQALWGTFIINTPMGQICFIGDTGYDSQIFKNIGIKYNNILVSLIPIGAYEPRWFMQDVHINPEEALLIHQDLKSKYSIASHFETFQLANEGYIRPRIELRHILERCDVSNKEFIIPGIGKSYWF